MNRYFNRTIEPSVEPVTAANVKLYSHVLHDVEDVLINTWIKAGRTLAENYLHRALITQTWELGFDSFPVSPICIPRAPLQSITSIKYYETDDTENTFASSNYFVETTSEPGRISLNHAVTWPGVALRPISAVKIVFVAGYGDSADDVPDFVKDAIYLYCAYRYENRIAEDGTIPSAIQDILRPERLAVY